jgi:hypothetical protein
MMHKERPLSYRWKLFTVLSDVWNRRSRKVLTGHPYESQAPRGDKGGRLLTTKQDRKDERMRIRKRERANESDYQSN